MGDRKPKGYWQNWNNILAELQPIIDKLGHFPYRDELEKFNLGGMADGYKYHGGTNTVRKKLGYEPLEKPKGYWKKWDTRKKELEKIINQLGHFPKRSELKGYDSNLYHALMRHDGGINSVRNKMGFKPTRNSKDYWQNWNNLEKELQPIIDQLGHFPTDDELRKLGKSSIASAFQYHDGINAVRKKLSYESKQKPRNFWQNWNNLEKELKPIIKKLGHFPSDQELESIKMTVISYAICNYHGGMNSVRQKFGYQPLERLKGYWQNWNNLEKELQPIITRLGHFPTQKDLKKINFQSLNLGFRYHGGLNAVKERLGYQIEQKPNGYWKDFENLEKELQPIITQLGHFPNDRELKNIGKSSVTYAINKYHGKFKAVKQKMGYSETQQLENLLEDYIGGKKNG